MNLNKQFINLIGVVVVLAILIAGIALIALPMWSQAQATDASTRTVAQTNSVYQAQIDQLTAAEARIDEIDAHVAALRAEIAPFGRLDDAFELIVEAAEEHELTLESVTAGDPEPFTARTALVEDGTAAGPPASTSSDEPDAPADATDATIDGAPAPSTADSTAQQQIVITIKVPVPDANTATAFIDDIRKGPRLISIIDATLDAKDSTLTVTALTFIRTED